MNKKREMRFEDARDIRAIWHWARRTHKGLLADDVQDYRIWEQAFYDLQAAVRVMVVGTEKKYLAGVTGECIFWCEGCKEVIMSKWKPFTQWPNTRGIECTKCGEKKDFANNG